MIDLTKKSHGLTIEEAVKRCQVTGEVLTGWSVVWHGDDEQLNVAHLWKHEHTAKRWRRFLYGLKGRSIWKLRDTREIAKRFTFGDIREMREEAKRLRALDRVEEVAG